MLKGVPLIEAHVHATRRPTLKSSWIEWAEHFGKDVPLSLICTTMRGPWTSMRENVWIEISGLPPKKLPEYYEQYDFERLTRKMIFGTDWPGVPGLKNNAVALFDLGLDHETVELIPHKNA